MTVHRSPNVISFHRSGPMSCPYIDGNVEQQLFTELHGPDAQSTYTHLSRCGFRRSHHVAYRPACSGCQSCIPVRIDVRNFVWSKGWNRVLKRNADLVEEDVGMAALEEHFALFSRYVSSRHGDGDMATMDRRDYRNLVLTSPVHTTLFEHRRAKDNSLKAVCLTDVLDDGFSAVYSFFDPDETARSLGSYMVLKLVERARKEGLPYVYLGFWIPQSRKMSYKARFRPLEGFSGNGWNTLD